MRLTGLAILLALLAGMAYPAWAAMKVTVAVEGLEGKVLENVLAYLSMEKQKDDSDMTGDLLKRLHARAPEEIRTAMEPFGYYSPRISSTLEGEERTWRALYRVEPGEPVVVRALHVHLSGEGAREAFFQTLLGAFPLREGEVFEHGRYEGAKRRLKELAEEYGYLAAAFTFQRAEVYAEQYAVDVRIDFATGPRYRFGEVTFRQDVLSHDFLRRYVPFERGEHYRLAKLYLLQDSLSASGYFSIVEVDARREEAENLEVPVEVRLEPMKRNRYTFGLGYGTDTGFRGSLGWKNRRVTSTGHRTEALLRLSEIQQSVSLRYIVPGRNPRTDSVNYSAGWQRKDTDTSTSETYAVGVNYTHLRWGWKETPYLRFEYEDFDVADDSEDTIFLMPGITWTRTAADDRIYARRGFRVSADLRGAHSAVLSETSFVQFRLQTKLIRGLWSTGRVLLRAEGGTSGVDDFSVFPATLRFFAGGDRSVRGYKFESLGPENEEGEVTGGKHLLFGSIEVEQVIYGKWSAAVFYDVGNAFNSLTESFKQGVGGGLRWRSPVGLVRVDLAAAISDPGDPTRLHIVIGPDL